MVRKIRVPGKARTKSRPVRGNNLLDYFAPQSIVINERPSSLDEMVIEASLLQEDYRKLQKEGLSVEYRGSLWELEQIERPTEYSYNYVLVFSSLPYAVKWYENKYGKT